MLAHFIAWPAILTRSPDSSGLVRLWRMVLPAPAERIHEGRFGRARVAENIAQHFQQHRRAVPRSRPAA